MLAEKNELRDSIEAFYKIGGIPMPTMVMSDRVASIFFEMLEAAGQCSVAFGYVPRPPGGRVTV
ncbi:MAG: hypothetical protein ACC707_12065 [Thiohalomonadales bacterium]